MHQKYLERWLRQGLAEEWASICSIIVKLKSRVVVGRAKVGSSLFIACLQGKEMKSLCA